MVPSEESAKDSHVLWNAIDSLFHFDGDDALKTLFKNVHICGLNILILKFRHL